MNWFSSKEKLVGLTQLDANLIRIGLMYVNQYGRHGLNHLIEESNRAPLHPLDEKAEIEAITHSQNLIEKFEDMLYAFEYDNEV